MGRETERRLVDRLVAGARIGNGGVLAITGEAGVGKTALLDYARSRLDGFRVLHATGTEPEREIPFAGLLSLLRPAVAQLDHIPGPQASALSAALALRDGSASDRFAIGAATLSLVCRYAEESPVAVIVDDLQVLDRPSADAVAFAARRLGPDPVALLLAARSSDSDDVIAGLPQLRLAGLDLAAARDLVRSVAGTSLTDEQLTRLHELTGGNPLAMVELGSDPEVLEHTGPEVPPPMPSALVAWYAKRVRLLDPATRSVLLVAVVSNGDLRLTSACCALLQLDPAGLAQAERAALIRVSGGQIGFRHPLLRAAVYADASPDERRAAHKAAADVLPQRDVDRRAWHLSEASWAPDAAVAAMLTSTAEHAVSRTAYAVASTAYERAARLSPDADSQVARLVKAAETAWVAGLGQRAGGLLDELKGLPVSAETLTTALELRAAIAARTGSLVEARDMLERAAAQTTSADTRLMLLAEAEHANLYLADTQSSIRLARHMTRMLGTATSTRAKAVGMMATGMAKVLSGQGGADEIRSAVPLLADSVELRSDPRRLPWLMLAPLFLRDTDTGTELRRTVDEVRDHVGVGTLPRLLLYVARDQATTDSWARAEANYAEAIRLARDTGQSTELAVSLAGLAWLDSRQGKAAVCRAHAAEALPICAERSIRLGEAWALFALGDLELSLGDPHAAVVHLQRLEDLLDELCIRDPDLSPCPELTDALLRLGRADDARRLSTAYLSAAKAKGQPWAYARAQRAVGLLASADELDRPFRRAIELHEQTPDTFETARTHFSYGTRLRRLGRRVDARQPLRQAMAMFAELGAVRWADQAATELDATGEKVPRRERSGVASLTSQELQVSLLLAEGRTTRETAAALFLSPKTVEYHLRKVYNKLGIRSRSELADHLPR